LFASLLIMRGCSLVVALGVIPEGWDDDDEEEEEEDDEEEDEEDDDDDPAFLPQSRRIL